MSTQVVLITGGLTGIGRAAAVAFAKKGAKVMVAGRRVEAGNILVKELRSLGAEAEFINADVRSAGSRTNPTSAGSSSAPWDLPLGRGGKPSVRAST
jgi:NAD(P)-dependent dehydrogenase (short-subunit alcohol dehydrogenase family)